MLIQLIKMIWKRKKTNSLIVAEVAIAFVVVFAIALIPIRNYQLYIEPLGFEYQDRWNIFFGDRNGSWESEHDIAQLKQLLIQLKQQPQIKNVHLLSNPTFVHWTGSSSYELNGRTINYFRNSMDDDAAQNFGLKLIKGRWFGKQDIGQNYKAVIVNRRFAERYFVEEDPINKNITGDDKRAKGEQETRIVGVFEDFRQQGELNDLEPYVISRYDIDKGWEIHNIEIKVTAGTTNAFEQKLMQLLTANAPNWEFTISQWESKREQALNEIMIPLFMAAIIASFFILLVAMGLFGVLWQNVISRTSEIGLRRALGATKKSIHLQIIGELMLVTVLGLLIGLALLIQLPISGLIPELTWSLFWSAQVAAVLFMLLLSVSCAYYPGKLATAFSPAEALHYE